MTNVDQQQKVKVLFLVFSGKASAIFDPFILNKASTLKNVKLVAIEGQWDDGGHTGYLLNWYRDGDIKSFLNRKDILGETFVMPPPMGDLKSQIARWTSTLWSKQSNIPYQETQQFKELMGYKTQTPEECIASLKKLVELISLHSQDSEIQKYISQNEHGLNLLGQFCDSYLRFSKLNLSESHSIGNLFLSFMYCLCYRLHKGELNGYQNHIEVFFQFLKKLNMVPDDIRLEFLVDGRYVLKGLSSRGNLVEGESTFDTYADKEDPIDPSTYELIEHANSVKLDENEEELFLNTNLLIIPPGSLTNWMPLLNKFGHIIAERKIPVIWVVNAFTHHSEVDLNLQLLRLNELGINPIILAPSRNPFDKMREMESEYFARIYGDELKTPVDFNTGLIGGYNAYRIMKYSIQYQGTGIKYDSELLGNILEEVLKELKPNEVSREIIIEKLTQISKEFTVH